jgi:tRNA pseudouridine38-40 synthase
MPRYRITIEYDGTPFIGWQRQAEGVSIQGSLESAIRNFSGETVGVRGAGRTDAGVHALGQVAHFDLTKTWEPGRIRDAMNFHLRPNPIGVLSSA